MVLPDPVNPIPLDHGYLRVLANCATMTAVGLWQ